MRHDSIRLTVAQEDIVRTLRQQVMIDFDGRRARALQVLERSGIIRHLPRGGYMLTDAGVKLADKLGTNRVVATIKKAD